MKGPIEGRQKVARFGVRRFWAFLLALVALGFYTHGYAALVQYHYDGHPFTHDMDGNPLPSDALGHVTLDFTLDLPSVADLPYDDYQAFATNWVMQDALRTLTPGPGNASQTLYLSTDGAGVPVRWEIVLEPSDTYINLMTTTEGNPPVFDLGLATSSEYPQIVAIIEANPGQWTITNVPIPSSLPLLVAGVLSIAWLGRRKWQSSASG